MPVEFGSEDFQAPGGCSEGGSAESDGGDGCCWGGADETGGREGAGETGGDERAAVQKLQAGLMSEVMTNIKLLREV